MSFKETHSTCYVLCAAFCDSKNNAKKRMKVKKNNIDFY